MWAERLGKYELVRHLASGGMAHVFLARVSGAAGFARHLVLKTMRPTGDDDPALVAMFLDEARLVATLHHQHIAQVYELGVTDDGTYYLAMEYLHGETVRAVLDRARESGSRLPLELGLAIAQATAAGLHHAHERHAPDGRHLGIVHRDVTPANILAGYDGSVKLIDFGIAKAIARATKTQTGFIKGKAGYMAPEQALGQPVDRRADVFSLGVVLYELTTGERAFAAATELEAAQRIARAEVVPPSMVQPGYPAMLEEVVMTALARDPDHRFPDADVMGRAIGAAADWLGVIPGPAAVARTMRRLFGVRAEPWLDVQRPGSNRDSGEITEERPPSEMDEGTTGLRPARKSTSWAVVPASGALAAYSAELAPDELSTAQFMSLEAGEPMSPPPPVLAVGTWPNPRMAVKVEVAPGQPAVPALVEVDEVEAAGGLDAPSDAGTNPELPVPRPLPSRVAPTVPIVIRPAATERSTPATTQRSAPPPPPAPAPPLATRPAPAPAPPLATRPVLALPRPSRRARSPWIAVRNLAILSIAAVVFGGLLGVAVSAIVGPPRTATYPEARPLETRQVITPDPPTTRRPPRGLRRAPARAIPPARVVTPAPPPSEPAPRPRERAKSATIRVRVTTEPPGATVLLDGRRLGHAPVSFERRRESRSVWLKVRRSGYATRRIEVSLDDDLVEHVVLRRAR